MSALDCPPKRTSVLKLELASIDTPPPLSEFELASIDTPPPLSLLGDPALCVPARELSLAWPPHPPDKEPMADAISADRSCRCRPVPVLMRPGIVTHDECPCRRWRSVRRDRTGWRRRGLRLRRRLAPGIAPHHGVDAGHHH